MREGTFYSLFFLDPILSTEFLSKISKLFWRWKLTLIGLIWHPAKLIESYQNLLLGCAKDEHFPCFLISCQLGLDNQVYYLCTWVWIFHPVIPRGIRLVPSLLDYSLEYKKDTDYLLLVVIFFIIMLKNIFFWKWITCELTCKLMSHLINI